MPTFTNPNSDNDEDVSDFMEKWSDAARAAAAAGRKALKSGKSLSVSKRIAIRAYTKATDKRTKAGKMTLVRAMSYRASRVNRQFGVGTKITSRKATKIKRDFGFR